MTVILSGEATDAQIAGFAVALRAPPGIFDAGVRVTTLPDPLAASEDAPTPRPVARLMPPDPDLLG